MGFRFRLKDANMLAHVLQPIGATPKAIDDYGIETLARFLDDFPRRFYSTPSWRSTVWEVASHAAHDLRESGNVKRSLRALRHVFKNVPWVAFLLPHGDDPETDHALTSEWFLQDLVSVAPSDPGLILQLDEPPRADGHVLNYVFPALRLAFDHVADWPAVLIWTPDGESEFLPLPRHRDQMRSALHELFHLLASHPQPRGSASARLARLAQLRRRLPQRAPRLRILHLSDIHLGSRTAGARLPRVQAIVRDLVERSPPGDTVLPLVTGDLMDTPSMGNLDRVRAFMDFLRGLPRAASPIGLLGNHDVRVAGMSAEDLRAALAIPVNPITWFEAEGVGLVCFNSNTEGALARGRVGDRQLVDVSNALDRATPQQKSLQLIAALHHHPIPVTKPPWYGSPWYGKLLGKWFEATLALEDADAFNAWAAARGCVAVLHGHKHIPRLDRRDGIAYVGCGSSVGKVDVVERGRTHMSVNVLTIDPERRQLTCHLHAERVVGGGLDDGDRHEVLFRSRT